ncbi:response regulator transcription factor [Bradyrhizobium sp. 6(2017)]|uniref:response regulator transcription factor n=1 Tax=Bradyrhizobium sp. 6(2017) TaxID=1197460 RepID=UPI0039C8A4B2
MNSSNAGRRHHEGLPGSDADWGNGGGERRRPRLQQPRENTMRKVLLIEDDRSVAEEIVEGLAAQRFEVEWASNGLEGLKMAHEWRPDALIVDRRPSGLDGLGIIQRLRQEQIQAPILMLSRLNAVEDRVMTLRTGADDYLIKPFALIELVARLDALLRRPMVVRETTLRIGTLELDLIERNARRRNRQIELLPREFRLLDYMMRRSGQLLTRSMLLKDVWNYNFDAKTNLIDVHMGRLRHKVDGPDEVPMIYNIRGAGFILREAASPPVASAPIPARAAGHQGHALRVVARN